jgi:3-oxoadipate enol-lactonase
MAIFKSQRGALHYETIGEGRPILLVHGFTNHGLAWSGQFAPLVHAGYQVIVPDLHGHGTSAAATALSTVADLSADMTALLGHLGVGATIVCGLSLGGMIAQQMAVDHPPHVAGIVVANSRASFNGAEAASIVEGWTALFMQEDGPVKRLRATWPALVNASFQNSAAGRAAFDAWSEILSGVSGASLSHVARGMTKFDMGARLGDIRVPSLVISGEHDRLFSVAHAQEIADGIPDASHATIEGAGHISSLDSADRFNRLLLDFLAAHCPAV